MTAALLTRPVSGQFELDGRGTLEELLGSAFDEARANGSTECPVCHARMVSARARGGAAAVGAAACGGCGSRLT